MKGKICFDSFPPRIICLAMQRVIKLLLLFWWFHWWCSWRDGAGESTKSTLWCNKKHPGPIIMRMRMVICSHKTGLLLGKGDFDQILNAHTEHNLAEWNTQFALYNWLSETLNLLPSKLFINQNDPLTHRADVSCSFALVWSFFNQNLDRIERRSNENDF